MDKIAADTIQHSNQGSKQNRVVVDKAAEWPSQSWISVPAARGSGRSWQGYEAEIGLIISTLSLACSSTSSFPVLDTIVHSFTSTPESVPPRLPVQRLRLLEFSGSPATERVLGDQTLTTAYSGAQRMEFYSATTNG